MRAWLSSFPAVAMSFPTFLVFPFAFNINPTSFWVPTSRATIPAFFSVTVTFFLTSIFVAIHAFIPWIVFKFLVEISTSITTWVSPFEIIVTVSPAVFAFHAWFR